MGYGKSSSADTREADRLNEILTNTRKCILTSAVVGNLKESGGGVTLSTGRGGGVCQPTCRGS